MNLVALLPMLGKDAATAHLHVSRASPDSQHSRGAGSSLDGGGRSLGRSGSGLGGRPHPEELHELAEHLIVVDGLGDPIVRPGSKGRVDE